MNPQVTTLGRSQSAVSSTNKVVKNTYMLLSMTLAFSVTLSGAASSRSMTIFFTRSNTSDMHASQVLKFKKTVSPLISQPVRGAL